MRAKSKQLNIVFNRSIHCFLHLAAIPNAAYMQYQHDTRINLFCKKRIRLKNYVLCNHMLEPTLGVNQNNQ